MEWVSRLFEHAQRAISGIAIAVGVLVLFGWAFDIPLLKGAMPGLVYMKANTALGFILSGISLWCFRPYPSVSKTFAAGVLLLGFLTLLEYVSGMNVGIDQILFKEMTNLPGDIPGRMATNTAVSFMLLGMALFLLHFKSSRLPLVANALAFGVVLIGGTALLAYFYDIEAFLRVKLSYTPMAIHTAAVFVLLGIGTMNARADFPMRLMMSSDTIAGRAARRLFPAAILLQLMAGYLILQGIRAGYFHEDAGLALFTTANILGLGALIYRDIVSLNRSEMERSTSEEKLRASSLYARSLLEASLDPLVTIDPGGKITDVNKAAVIATGIEREKLTGSDFSDYFTEPEKAKRGYRQVFEKGEVRDYPLTLRRNDGKLIDVLYNASLYKDERGEVAGVFAAARDITERKASENALAERVKELQALYTLSALAERKDLSLSEFFQELAHILPQSWQYPEIACARISVREAEFKSRNFRVSEWMQQAPIFAEGSVIGKVEIGYLEKEPELDEGPFLKEERLVLNAIAERLGRITERHDAEAALRASERYARNLLETSLDPLVTISTEGKITDVNEATINATGLARNKLIGSDFSDYFTVPEKAKRGYREVFEKGEVRDYPLTLRRNDGKLIDVLYNASLYKDERGEVAGVFAVARDITAHKALEEARRVSEARFATIFNQAPLGVALIDSHTGRIYDVNPRFAEIAGRSIEEMVSIDWMSITHPDDVQKDLDHMALLNAGKILGFNMEKRYVRPDGTYVWINMTIAPLREADVSPRHLCMIDDITQRKEAEEELKIYREHLEELVKQRTEELEAANANLKKTSAFLGNLIESIPEPMFYKDRQGVYRGGNDAFFEYLGLPRGSVVGKTVYDINPRHLADLYRKADDELFGKGGIQVYESRVRYADGAEHDVIFHKSIFQNPDGSQGGIIGTILDISQRKQAELEREHLLAEIEQRARAADEANKELESFAYSVSHDLRVPLRAVDGFSKMILARYEDKLDDEGKRLLNVVRDNSKKMAQLIDDILSFSRMGRLEMDFSTVDMENLARSVYEELKPGIEGRKIKVEFGEIPPAKGDPAMLRQVWMNLVANAMKFTRPKGDALIEIGGTVEGNEHVYCVRDNGVGFDMQYVDKLFGVFQRLHGVEEFEGTGIGLAIVKRIANRHGGRAWAKGEVGKGAEFCFSLPAKQGGKNGSIG